MSQFYTLDLNFLGYTQAIATYVFPHKKGIVLIESGPGSTLTNLETGLQDLGYELKDITDVFLTHIHLDHAGASGALAQLGARIHVHPNGAPHMIDPEKLLMSAGRIYGDDMHRLWGEFLAVPVEQVHILTDGCQTQIGDLDITALDTPGHANHHFAYLVNGTCFCGDVGGIRIQGVKHIRLPMPPPELNLELWRQSIQKLRKVKFTSIAPTHFGVFDDPVWHLDELERIIDNTDTWISEIMANDPPVEKINELFQRWTAELSNSVNLSEYARIRYETANPSWMTAAGIKRYWRKYRASSE